MGDRILFGKYCGSEIKLDDQADLFLREDEILASFVAAQPKQPGFKK